MYELQEETKIVTKLLTLPQIHNPQIPSFSSF